MVYCLVLLTHGHPSLVPAAYRTAADHGFAQYLTSSNGGIPLDFQRSVPVDAHKVPGQVQLQARCVEGPCEEPGGLEGVVVQLLREVVYRLSCKDEVVAFPLVAAAEGRWRKDQLSPALALVGMPTGMIFHQYYCRNTLYL